MNAIQKKTVSMFGKVFVRKWPKFVKEIVDTKDECYIVLGMETHFRRAHRMAIERKYEIIDEFIEASYEEYEGYGEPELYVILRRVD